MKSRFAFAGRLSAAPTLPLRDSLLSIAERPHLCSQDGSEREGYPPFPHKETTVYRMVYRESTRKELDNRRFPAAAETLHGRGRHHRLGAVGVDGKRKLRHKVNHLRPDCRDRNICAREFQHESK
jgi:hypothetical protein